MSIEELQIIITALGSATETAGWVIAIYIIAANVIQPVIIAITILVICLWCRGLIREGMRTGE